MNLSGKTFRAMSNSTNGSLDTRTEMVFQSDDGLVRGTYAGGTITTGHVLAKHLAADELDMLYQGATTDGVIQAGRARARFSTENDGPIKMHLDWQWLTGDRTTGESEWIEID